MSNFIWLIIIPVLIGLIHLFVEYKTGLLIPKKRLQAEILIDTPLFEVNVYQGYDEKIEVLFNGKPAYDLSVFVIRIANTGQEPIVSEDYEIPFNIRFFKPVSIKHLNVSSSNPSDLPVKLHIVDNKVSLQPLLLNGGDYFTLKFLLSGVEEDPFFAIGGRIINIPKIELKETGLPRSQSQSTLLTTIMIMAIIMAIGVFLAINYLQRRP